LFCFKLFSRYSLERLGKTGKNVRKAGNPVEIRAVYLYTNLLGRKLVA